MDAETVLLVDHGKDQIVEGDGLLEQRVGADDDVDLAACQAGQRIRAFAALLATGEDGDAKPYLGGKRRDGRKMLARQDFGRCHQGCLAAGLDGTRHGQQRDDSLAGTDIALQKPQHALWVGEVGIDFGQRKLLA